MSSSLGIEGDEIHIQSIPYRYGLGDDLRPSGAPVSRAGQYRHCQPISSDGFGRYRPDRRREEDLRTVADRFVPPLYCCPDLGGGAEAVYGDLL